MKHTILRTLLVSLAWSLSLSASNAQELRVEEHDAAYVEKMKKLKPAHHKEMPQLFFCGDSISVGYGPALKVALEGKVNALHRKDLKTVFPDFKNFGYSGPIHSLNNINNLVLDYEAYTPTILMLNSGLHDVQRGRNNPDKALENYLNTLKKIIEYAEMNEVKIIWLNTTHFGAGKDEIGSDFKRNPTVDRFNQAAAALMKGHYVIDLSQFCDNLINKHGEEKIMTKDKVHFTEFGQIEQGKFLAAEVLKIMKVK